MQPVAADQDYLRTPLNELLGAPANVRLLRLLSDEVSEPIGAPDASEYTGLTEAGARRALKRLASTGFVEQIGGGRAQRFRLRDADPLTAQLRALFRAERLRHQSLISELREILGQFPEIQVAWVDDPPSESGQPLHIGLLAGTRTLSYLSDQVRKRIIDIEAKFDITIELHAFSQADEPEVTWENAELLAGHVESVVPQTPSSPRHLDREEQASAIARAIAHLLDEDPSLLKRAERHLEMLLEREQGPASHDLREWRDILTRYSRPRLKEFLVAGTPRAQRLRQSSPFSAVLTQEELGDVVEMAKRQA
ncbi:MAG: winged helix-turn-helix domain-containing protein [Candidatus Palauibacterales bacterium]|nr:winged helix-turn-helix domain-containing protein [Candidatus Palauibacterales bacterium]MDP2528393.1 winged helix-turn-helix domain-containing protein [Candidatus Palauibacterales bacterium]MDP2584979.1 winged helix-turn-helix domain-containing protein [Candidatus Palauibacterales bacterium]